VADTASGQARRRFLRLAAAGMVAMPLCGGCLVHRARAQERVAEDNELAQQLGYKHDASEVDPNEWPDYREGHICANCQLYHGGGGRRMGTVRHLRGHAGQHQRLVQVLDPTESLSRGAAAPSGRAAPRIEPRCNRWFDAM